MAAVETLASQEAFEAFLRGQTRRWLVTGVAGFIGSHLLETLLGLGQQVVGLDNFATGRRSNLDDVRQRVGAEAWRRFALIEGDIVDPEACARACSDVQYVLHQAALGSVPRSIEDPQRSHASNVTGMLNMLVAARDAKVARFVYASSSSVYGDEPNLPKVEERIGRPLSPYAATKLFDEVYAEVFGRSYGLQTIGLRYFNVFGPRQDPNGPYAAVIPRWAAAMLAGEPCVINGDGETSRDFCYVANAVQANLRAALVENPAAVGQVYNVAVGGRTTLKQLHTMLADALREVRPDLAVAPPTHVDFRAGDVRHSEADIGKVERLLGYRPTFDLFSGLKISAVPFATA
ncbi:NAD-dependent epimerase/dehydratase [Burkholderiales bacterium GJ-E10]|nr:NAD-dependent epimerase/dehydratase [Burkholderiales bacterium GJ-E10]